jgi:hypothetical protein
MPSPLVLSDEKKLDVAIQQGDLDMAIDFCSRLVNLQKMSGLALAKALWMIHDNWNRFEIDEDFKMIMAIRLDIHPHTVERYVRVYDLLLHAPEEVVAQLESKNIGDLFPVANAVAQGYTVDDDTWKDIADAPSQTDVSRIVREDVKGAEPRATSLSLSINQAGEIWAWKSNQRYFIGSLEISNEDETVQKAIERIVKNSGISVLM